jgi:ATP-dependent RNA helicase RhlE
MQNRSYRSSRPSNGGGFSKSSSGEGHRSSSSGRSGRPFQSRSGSSRSSSGGGSSRSGGGFRSAGGYRGGGFRGRSGGGSRRSGSRIDPAKLVNRATGVEEIVYVAQNKFIDFNIDEKLKQNIISKGYTTPTPIQDQSIPHILQGKDVIGIASTGTGKTAAFLLPLINKVMQDKSQKVLIIVPTRELAMQIQDEFIAFARGTGVTSVSCIGGTSMYRQIGSLRRQYNFIIGTPGRLKDLSNRRAIDLSNCNNVVLDEVDRMLDMGFIIDIKFLLAQLPAQKQSLFFSATITREIDTLIRTFLNDPVSISLKTRDTASTVDQDVVRVTDRTKKVEILHDMLIKDEFTKVLIFAKTKMGVRKLSMSLYERGFKVESIHGDKTQSRRQKALDMFKQSRVNILVATDVAARGIDVADISHVINFDMPENYEDYIHRIGRTGRANKKGVALTFVE